MLSFKIAFSSIKTSYSFPFKNLTLIPNFKISTMASSSSSSSSSASWSCSKCTFINTDSKTPNCKICSFPQTPLPLPSNQEKWSCKACTFFNPYKLSHCEICGTRNSPFSSSLSLGLEDQELDLASFSSSDVGNVFLPLLRKCSNNNTNKRKISDDGLVNHPVDLGFSRGSKSADRKVVDLDELEGSRDSKAIFASGDGKAIVASDENTQPKEDTRTLKILSYNVWFAEEIELRIRMRAIGDIIQLHSPDVICLQEVTPTIYAILQRSGWWKSYKCSLSYDNANTRPYYCMQLSKLPVKSFGIEQFSYSAMGRELCITEVSVGGNTPLVVATTHLESPCPGPPKWDQMYSKERVKQANEAVNFLKKNPNVIFCGDMNWDDKLDGEFPLPNGWVDAWTELNPTEIGWTYDTKANLMLSANRKLQKRLDRFLISLRDFKMESVKMVGNKPIAEVTYMKQKKGGKEVELPVLPSDHFGLLLTMSAQ